MKEVSSQVDSNQLELDILEIWQRERVFELSLEQSKDKPLFTFYDGPPYATGVPHYGHVLQSALKDTVLRYKTMQGYYVPRTVGWDTHGLPIENIVEKELGFKSKKDIETFGIREFNERCRQTVTRYIDVFTNTLRRMGRWADYEHGYFTMDTGYMNAEWGVFRQLWDKGLVYKSFRSTPYCIRCATPLSNFEVSMAYKDTTDLAVYVALLIVGSPTRRANEHLLIWTTTPWTLPGNAAVAINPDIAYVSVWHEDKEIIIAKERVKAVFGEDIKVVREWTTEELLGLKYERPYGNEGIVIPSAHVTTDEGTGLVHIAPAFGEEDYELGKKFNLPTLKTVDSNGLMLPIEGLPAEALAKGGLKIFDANKPIAADLEQRGLLFKKEYYRHSYPHCWRCDTPLIYYAIDSWFVRVTQLKERMLAINEDIHWTPEHVKHGRFAKGIESAPDWAVSRSRYWSVPLPVWECDGCHEQVCVESIDELKKLSGREEIPDIHRPYVDEVSWPCKKCSGVMKRTPEVLDVWFDAGSMPYATHQPFPADFIVESIEMTRAWFYVLHVLAVALKDQLAFKNVIGSGIIFAEDGKKLSKKLKNYPDVEPTIEKYGADVLRFYLLVSSSLGEPYRFSEKEMRHVKQNTYTMLWNVYSFFTRYANAVGWTPAKSGTSPYEGEVGRRPGEVLDQWLLARLKQLTREVTECSESYEIDTAARAFILFIDDLSNWYVRRSRERFQGGDKLAFAVLYDVLVELTKLLAPFMPFVSEAMYRNLTGEVSVHLTTFPAAAELTKVEEKIVSQMTKVREIVSAALAARAAAKIKVRQPLTSLTAPIKDLPVELLELIKDEVNVKQVVNGPELKLDIVITPELAAEGAVREIIRHGQLLRRQAGYALNDRIKLVFTTDDRDLQAVFAGQQAFILRALQADTVRFDGPEDAGQDIDDIGAAKIHLGVSRGE